MGAVGWRRRSDWRLVRHWRRVRSPHISEVRSAALSAHYYCPPVRVDVTQENSGRLPPLARGVMSVRLAHGRQMPRGGAMFSPLGWCLISSQFFPLLFPTSLLHTLVKYFKANGVLRARSL